MMIKPHTEAECVEHVKVGVGGQCPVCDGPLLGRWTDYNGQIRCCTCGATCQILGSHHAGEWLAKHGLTAKDVADRYCDCFEFVPLLRVYWHEMKVRVPFGTYFMSEGDIRPEEHHHFYAWVAARADELRPAWDDYFDWERLLERYGTKTAAG